MHNQPTKGSTPLRSTQHNLSNPIKRSPDPARVILHKRPNQMRTLPTRRLGKTLLNHNNPSLLLAMVKVLLNTLHSLLVRTMQTRSYTLDRDNLETLNNLCLMNFNASSPLTISRHS